MRDEGLLSPRGSVAFKDVLTQLFASDELCHKTKEDLTTQKAFSCLLHIAEENNFHMEEEESGGDLIIMRDPIEDPSMT